MVKVEKLIKLSTNSSKVRSIIKKIKQKSNHSVFKIKTYQKKLQNFKNRISTKNYNKTKTKAKASTKTKATTSTKTHKIIKKHPSIIISNMELLPTTVNTLDNTNHGNKNYVIAIPSYNRSDSIQTKTLTVLQQNNIEPSLIHIFVANKEQYDIYLQAIPKHLYGTLVIGILGLKNQRNYINDYYTEGTHIVELDDDITSIVQLIVKDKSKGSSKSSKGSKGSKSSKSRKTMKSTKPIKFIKPIINLDAFIKHAFKICTENGSFLWGVYPIANAHFMTPTVTKDLRFIVGPMFGMINRHRHDLQLTIDENVFKSVPTNLILPLSILILILSISCSIRIVIDSSSKTFKRSSLIITLSSFLRTKAKSSEILATLINCFCFELPINWNPTFTGNDFLLKTSIKSSSVVSSNL